MTPPDFNSFLPEGESLFDYQQVGVAYALITRRCFIADEMGLGKTRQALVALEASGVLDGEAPAVIVCPASLKANWEREIVRCLPHRSVQVLAGKTPFETFSDILVINYDILSAWAEGIDPSAVVFDESHYAKDPGTAKKPVQRTVASIALANRVPADGLVLCLTGTAILNRPIELITQLQILGRLREVAPQPRTAAKTERDWEFAFKHSFCGAVKNDYGKWEYKGASNLVVLNDRLRQSCFVRRLRSEVLGTEDTRRIVTPLALNGALDTYRKAEANLISFLHETKGVEAAAKARNAEVLVSLNTLRNLAGLAKIDTTVEWVKSFFEQNDGRSLVVFAWHKEVQSALVKAFPGCSTILGGQKDVEAQKARFLAGETKLIVCSIKAAKEGHTLVGPDIDCHDVLFVEQAWNPGTQQQAEDRINRIGQTAQFVFAHYLLGAGTIDEDVYKLIEKKRATFKAAIDGGAQEEVDEADIQAEVIRLLENRG